MALHRGRLVQAAAVLAIAATAASADDYPSRTVRIVVPTAPAGGYDIVGRAVADQLARRLNQSVVVENRTGAGTVVGTQSVIASAPDGYTLLVGGLSNIVYNGALYKKAPYDATTQLVPVAIFYKLPYVLLAGKNTPFSTVRELVAAAKQKPGELRLGHAGVGTGHHLASVAFMKRTGTRFQEVPYRGASAVYPDVIAGRVELLFDTSTGALPAIRGGNLKVLAVAGSERLKEVPAVPTMKELGIDGLEIDSWIGLFAPARTPKPVIDRLQREVAAAMPDLKARFVTSGGDVMEIAPDRLAAFVHDETTAWTRIIKDAGIALD